MRFKTQLEVKSSINQLVKYSHRFWAPFFGLLATNLLTFPLRAQVVPRPQIVPPPPTNLPRIPQIPQPQPQPLQPPVNLPSPDQKNPELYQQGTIRVNRFIFKGATVFSAKQLEAVVASLENRDITFSELLAARTSIAKFYTDRGFINSGAFIPPQDIRNGEVVIQIVEGKVETLTVTGSQRIREYVRSRLRAATSPVLNENRLREKLQLLQVNPLIEQISAELQPGSQPGEANLSVYVKARQPVHVQFDLNNERSPLVGSFERRIQFSNANLLGLGDGLSLTYRNTDGSNAGQASYTLPVNPQNGTVQFDYTIVHSNIIEPPFDQLRISADYRSYAVTFRQPLLQQADSNGTKEFALGLIASRQEGDERLLDMPFPVSPGDDSQGRTRISALRFFQEWAQRSSREVILARSEFSFGIGVLDATIQERGPDSRFFIWRGQAAWLHRLNRQNLTLVARVDLQFADRPLVPFEQFSLGGVSTVRGYRQDLNLTDSGVLGSLELRIPLVSNTVNQLQLAPFIDVGTGFNNQGANPDPNTLAGIGLGIEYQLGDQLRARLDYGIPIVAYPNRKRNLQENGLYLNLQYAF